VVYVSFVDIGGLVHHHLLFITLKQIKWIKDRTNMKTKYMALGAETLNTHVGSLIW